MGQAKKWSFRPQNNQQLSFVLLGGNFRINICQQFSVVSGCWGGIRIRCILATCCPKVEKGVVKMTLEQAARRQIWGRLLVFSAKTLLLMHRDQFEALSANLQIMYYMQYNTCLLNNVPHYLCNGAAFSVVYHRQD